MQFLQHTSRSNLYEHFLKFCGFMEIIRVYQNYSINFRKLRGYFKINNPRRNENLQKFTVNINEYSNLL